MLVPNGPVTMTDVVDAARLLLDHWGKNSALAWRQDRWYSDQEVRDSVTECRRAWEAQTYRGRQDNGHVFGARLAQDIILAGLPYAPMAVVSSLDQLGLTPDSPDADVVAAVDLLDRPELFDPIRVSGFPVTEVRVAVKVFGLERFQLMLAAAMTPAEVVEHLYRGECLDLVMLRTMAGLLRS